MSFDVPRLSRESQTDLATPALLVWPDRIEANIRHMIDIAGGPGRLRPHCKTHKMQQVAEMLVAAGITHHKAATVVEVEMLCKAGAQDVVLAGNPVGPALTDFMKVVAQYPSVTFAITADADAVIRQIAMDSVAADTVVGVMLDLDVGLHRTGVLPDSAEAEVLYQLIEQLPGVRPAGLHVYDGHQHQTDYAERREAVQHAWQPVVQLLKRLQDASLAVTELLCGGTPSFPVYAEMSQPEIRISPGTCTLHDVGYGRTCPDLVFDVAAAVATRVVSNTVPGQLTLDVGHKAIAGDPPAGGRVWFPELPDATATIHNEEHLTVTSTKAGNYAVGDLLMALPIHICPSVALHHKAVVVRDGKVTDRWFIHRHRDLADAKY